MVYTALEIVLFMVLAGALGFVAGWFLQRARRVEVIISDTAARQLNDDHRAAPYAEGDHTIDLRQIEGTLSPSPAGSDVEDDLTRIRGIGPKLSEQLNAMGITTYAQIAAFTDEDIDAVGAALGRFGGRIRSDGWVESARSLAGDRVI